MNSKERHEARYQRRKAAREKKRAERLGKYDDFDRLSATPSLLHAHWEARRGVTFKASVLRYDINQYKNATRQSHDLRAGKDVRQRFYVFDIRERGKLRHIHSLHYAERVIRRSVCTNALVPVLSNGLIYDNSASLEGKGVSFAADRCEAHLHRYFRETGSNEGYIAVIDFKGYFDHILHAPLKQIIDKTFSDKRIVNLACGFIDVTDWDKPPELRGQGLYIGPEDSQIYAVAYPNRIDHLLKDDFRLKYYARYMDDSYIIHKDKAALKAILARLMEEYARYGIIPNKKKTQIVKLSKGFTYLKTRYFLTKTGHVVKKPDHDCIVRERRKLKRMLHFYMDGIVTLDQVSQSYMSWRGAILKRDAHRTVQHMDDLFFSLYGAKPWRLKHERKVLHNERKTGSDHGRNHRAQNAAA